MPAVIFINIDPILVQLGPIAVHWYGVMYVVGIIIGIRIALPYGIARGLTEDQIWTVVGPCIIAGLIGGRLFYVVQQPLGPFLAQPWRIIATWEGGMAFFGAIAGVLIALAIICQREKLSFWTFCDTAAIMGTVGQAFGRIGNIINGDILGAPTNLPWGMVYTNIHSFAASHVIAYQPAAAYEIVADIILFAVLWTLRFRFRSAGTLLAIYLIGYSITQFLVFFLRDTEPIVGFGLKQAQLTSIVVFAIGVALAVWRGRYGEPIQTAPPANAPERSAAQS